MIRIPADALTGKRCTPIPTCEKKLTELTHIRSCTAITDGNVELAAENGMLCVRRKAGGEGVSLYINMTEEQRRQEHCLKADSKVLSAHRASVLPAAGDGKMTCGVCPWSRKGI